MNMIWIRSQIMPKGCPPFGVLVTGPLHWVCLIRVSHIKIACERCMMTFNIYERSKQITPPFLIWIQYCHIRHIAMFVS